MDSSRVIAGIAIAAGLFYVGTAIKGFHERQRYVEVRGMAEKIVKSDKAVWQLSYSIGAGKFAEVNRLIQEQQPVVRQFLLQKGFKEGEIQKPAPEISEGERNEKPWFCGKQTFIVDTRDVDRVARAVEDIEPLLAAGVMIDSNKATYYFTNLNAIKPEMLRTAAANARQAAEGFAKDANTAVGGIRQASQGLFEINAPLEEYDQSTVMKKVRVVTSMDFYLK